MPLLTTIFLAAAPGNVASATRPGPRVQLAGTTRISASQPGYISVTIPNKVTLSYHILARSSAGPTEDIAMQGPGRIIAVALVRDPPGKTTSDFFVAARFGRCYKQGCDPRGRVINFQVPGDYASKNRRVTLPPGPYRLYLLADGEPVSVVLTLHGLPGSTTVRPDHPAPADLRTPSETLVASASENYFAAGNSYESGTRGLLLSATWARSQQRTDFYYGLCHQVDLSPLPNEVAFGPHCEALSAAGSGATAFGFFRGEKGIDLSYAGNYVEPPIPELPQETAGFGWWILAEGPMTETGSHTLFLPWDN